MSEVVLVLLAGGNGTRFKSEKPKQLAMLAGRPLLEHTLANIVGIKELDQIIISTNSLILDEVNSIVSKMSDHRIKVVTGGRNRLESTRAGVLAVNGLGAKKILVHDSVRPFLPHSVVKNCISQLDQYDAVDVVIPSSDTLIKSTYDHKIIEEIPLRSRFMRGQTPQGFWLNQLLDAYEKIPNLEDQAFSDDCGLLLSAFPGSLIGLVEGSETNIKITHPTDLFLAEQFIQSGQVGNNDVGSSKLIDKLNVVIFGATSGLGLATKDELETLGVSVFEASRSTGVDISDYNQVCSFLDGLKDNGVTINAILNFSGLLKIEKLHDMSIEDVHHLIGTNYIGSINVAKASYLHLKDAGGQLVMVSSSSYYRGRADYSVYSSSKSAVVNLTQALAEEWAEDNIQVNCIVPRRSNTPMRWNAFPDEDRATLLKPEQVAAEVIKLLKSTNTGMICHVY